MKEMSYLVYSVNPDFEEDLGAGTDGQDAYIIVGEFDTLEDAISFVHDIMDKRYFYCIATLWKENGYVNEVLFYDDDEFNDIDEDTHEEYSGLTDFNLETYSRYLERTGS